jgi:hypothetical protein
MHRLVPTESWVVVPWVDTGWEMVGEYATQQDAKDAAK